MLLLGEEFDIHQVQTSQWFWKEESSLFTNVGTEAEKRFAASHEGSS